MLKTTALLATLAMPVTAVAQNLPTSPYLPLAMAVEAANAALAACGTEGHNVSVAIVARDGNTKALLKGDNSGPHTASSATGKAFASAGLGRDAAGLADFIAGNPQNNGLRDMDPRLVIQAGGLPIRIGGALVGGIGVGGAPSGTIDADCARKGLDLIGAE